MMNRTKFEDLGKIDYKKAWDYQEEVFKSLTDIKLFNRENVGVPKELINRLLFYLIHDF